MRAAGGPWPSLFRLPGLRGAAGREAGEAGVGFTQYDVDVGDGE